MRIKRVFRGFTCSWLRRARGALLVVVLLAGVGGLAFYHRDRALAASGRAASGSPAEHGGQSSRPSPGAAASDVLPLSRERLAALHLETQPVGRSAWQDRLRVTGRLELNASRIAQVSSLAQGVIREVCVELGDTVEANQVLAHVASREVGEAKLRLVRERANLEAARKSLEWDQTTYENATALLKALREGKSAEQIEEQFQARPLGSYREQLVSAAARVKRAGADDLRVRALSAQGVIAEKQAVLAQTEHEAARAAYGSLIEQITFEAQQRLLLARQRVQESEGAVAISRSHLLILGYSREAADAMEPLAEGERVAYYPVRAPLAGTVIAKPALLSKHVDAQTTLVEIADLSTVWLRADVFEKDLESAAGLKGRPVTFRAPSYPQRVFSATVFTVGHLVSEDTRAVRLLAVADNAQRLLKPGMFVDIELERGEDAAVLQVPDSAIQRHEGACFVFVALAGGTVARRDVRVGRSQPGLAEITSGLDGGESVVVKGGFALKSEMLREWIAE